MGLKEKAAIWLLKRAFRYLKKRRGRTRAVADVVGIALAKDDEG